MRTQTTTSLVTVLLFASPLLQAKAADQTLPVSIHIDASKPIAPLTPIWRFFGYDECNYTYMPAGRKLLSELGDISKSSGDQIFIRCHHLLTSGDGSPALKWGSTNIYSEDSAGNAIYSWTIVDRIFDTYRDNGLKPYVELGFMPKDLTIHPELYPTTIDPNHRITGDDGVAYPPKDYNKWRELARQWVLHCIDRYGADQVKTWYWEVWNEPNISYWRGTPQEYYKLYDYAVDGIKAAMPEARVGGPETAGDDRFTRNFLDHCVNGTNYATGAKGAPLDFISFHAKGRPLFVNGHVRMGLGDQLNVIERNFKVIASFHTLKSLPIVIGESDPDGMAARLPTESPAVGYRNTTLFSSYTADAIAREYDLTDQTGVNLQGALTWSFEFENKPYFAGFRTLSTNGIDLPVMNVFRMLAKMSGNRLSVQSDAAATAQSIIKSGVRKSPDISALAAIDNNQMTILLWNYHDDDIPGPGAEISLNLNGLPTAMKEAKLTEYRIDHDHSNSYTRWQSMGSPQTPTKDQYDQLVNAGHLSQLNASTLTTDAGRTTLHVSLPRQAVSLLVLQWH